MNDDDFAVQLEFEEQEKRLRESSSTSADPYTYVDPTDGTTYEWDRDKQAWFPKISEEFLAAYQANYGNAVADTGPAVKNEDRPIEQIGQQPKLETGEKRKANDEQGWFDVSDEHNTNVYVSNLPEDITDEEFSALMSKCGIIMKDPDTHQLKVKLYRDPNGQIKGDGRCCYIKVESVHLALSILDGYEIRGKTIKVERAKFQLKGEYDPSKKPKKKKGKDKRKIKQMQEKLLDWRAEKEEGSRLRCERTVIIKNMFDPKEFEEDAALILDYQNDLREECAKFGVVKKVKVYDRHPKGVAAVTFEDAEMADACISAMNNRWFAARQLEAHAHDGKIKYDREESETDRDDRLKNWEKFLDGKKE